MPVTGCRVTPEHGDVYDIDPSSSADDWVWGAVMSAVRPFSGSRRNFGKPAN